MCDQPSANQVPIVLFDRDLERVLDIPELIQTCRTAVNADARGELVSPPRHHVDFDGAAVAFTSGGLGDTFGFRAYDIMQGSLQDQVVAVWSRESGRMIGAVIGKKIGAYRTGALGGVAVDRLAPRSATTCGVIGTGLQATTQLQAIAAVRPLERVWCYSRSTENRRTFADQMAEQLDIAIEPTQSAREAVEIAEIVVAATTSRSPVLDEDWLRDDAHINAIGPKFTDAFEVDAGLVSSSWRIASDSPQQIQAYGDRYFIGDTSTLDRIEHLGTVEVADSPRPGRTTFLSTGLAGTEVLVAEVIIRTIAASKGDPGVS